MMSKNQPVGRRIVSLEGIEKAAFEIGLSPERRFGGNSR
jgi:hypothetical protein